MSRPARRAGKGETVSAERVSEVARCIRALHDHRRGSTTSRDYWYWAGYEEAIRVLGERRGRMKLEMAAHRARTR